MNKSVLITGATGYFGSYLTKDLARDYHVIACARDAKKLDQLCHGINATPLVIDLYDTKKITESVKDIAQAAWIFGLINNAYDFSPKTGFNTPEGKFELISEAMLRAGLESGILAHLLFTQAVGNQMIDKGIKGSIINISSMYGQVAPDAKLYRGKNIFNPITYGVAKASLDAMTRYVASFWGQYGIRCNSVAPGSFPNIETDSCNAPKDEDFIKRLEDKTVLGRAGHPKDLLGTMRLLLSEDSSYLTGQIISIDGGWTVT